MYSNSVKITNKEAKNILYNKTVVLIKSSSISDYTNSINYYNAGIYGWNYSIAFNARINKWVICGYRIPNAVLTAAKEIVEMTYEKLRING